jgi:hypothetical protein
MTQKDTESTQAYLANIIARIIERKEKENIVPLHAGMQEILALANTEFREALNDMVSAKILTFHRTLNDVSFEFTRPK